MERSQRAEFDAHSLQHRENEKTTEDNESPERKQLRRTLAQIEEPLTLITRPETRKRFIIATVISYEEPSLTELTDKDLVSYVLEHVADMNVLRELHPHHDQNYFEFVDQNRRIQDPAFMSVALARIGRDDFRLGVVVDLDGQHIWTKPPDQGATVVRKKQFDVEQRGVEYFESNIV